jgi:tetratricopeptide (TPR) repeat protein
LARIARMPTMMQALCDFGAGQRGADKLRLQADEIAAEAGLIPDGPRRRWIDGAWRNIAMMRVKIHAEVEEREHAPGVFDLIRRAFDASRDGDFALAETSLREALIIDPNDRTAMNNLASVYEQMGRQEEAISLSARLHELHPDYLFGRTVIAGVAIDRGELDRARDLLKPLMLRQRLHISELSAICSIKARLHDAAGEREQVEHWLEIWRQTAPDDPALHALEQRLR